MNAPKNSPRDLATLVYATLRSLRGAPSVEVLEELFQVLFLTSLQREEGAFARCSLAYASPRRPDPHPPKRIRTDRWIYSPFEDAVPLTVRNLCKLAVASDADLSSFAVFANGRGQLEISGMFDQQAGFKALLRYESAGGAYDPPGLFQVEIRDLGHIVVTQAATIIGELSGGRLVSESQEVFRSGPVRDVLANPIKRFCKTVRSVAANAGHPISDRRDADEYMGRLWCQTLRRLLLRAQAQGHGGAFLLTSEAPGNHLRLRHQIRYDRVAHLLAISTGHWFVKQNVYDAVNSEYIETGSDTIPVDLYFDQSIADGENDDADAALSDAIGFVATLSRLDGLVLMDMDLNVSGFGVEITVPDADMEVVSVRTGSSVRGKRLPIENFGTRHRSMFRYCAAHPGSLGFVLSEDGPVRTVLRHRSKVLVWENIRLRPSAMDELA